MGQDRLDGLGDPKQVKYVPWVYLLSCLLWPGNICMQQEVYKAQMCMQSSLCAIQFLFRPIPSHPAVPWDKHGYRLLVKWNLRRINIVLRRQGEGVGVGRRVELGGIEHLEETVETCHRRPRGRGFMYCWCAWFWTFGKVSSVCDNEHKIWSLKKSFKCFSSSERMLNFFLIV